MAYALSRRKALNSDRIASSLNEILAAARGKPAKLLESKKVSFPSQCQGATLPLPYC